MATLQVAYTYLMVGSVLIERKLGQTDCELERGNDLGADFETSFFTKLDVWPAVSHSGDTLLEYDTVGSGTTPSTFRRIVLPVSSVCLLIASVAYSYYFSSETSMKLYRTTRRHNPR
jgi:hypothetical protein